MDKGTLEQVSRHVAKKFPEMAGVRPTIRRQGNSSSDDACFVLTYKGKAELPGGRKMSRIVRVVANESGRVIRMSTSK
jgi:hypothetical protein